MSDLELSDNEKMSDNDNNIQLKPTFSIKNDNLNTNEVNYLGEELKKDDEDSIVNLDEENDDDVNNLDDEDSVNDSDNDSVSDSDNDSIIEEEDNEEEDKYNSDIEQDAILNKKKSANYGGKKVTNKNIEEMPLTKIDIPTNIDKNDSDFDSDDDDEDDDEYLQKFDAEMRENYILKQHPETNIHNYDEVYKLAIVQRNKNNIIVDDLHKTIPILTKYEKTKVLGLRAKQLNNGAKAFVKFSKNIIDGYLIALKELEEKKIPVIIRRPLPNGASEYWHLRDLEII